MECFFAFTMVVTMSMPALMYWVGLEKGEYFNWMSFSGATVLFLFLFSTFYPWTHPKKTFVYRRTSEGFEVQSWNNIEHWKTVAIVVGVILVVAILALASVFPGLPQ